MKIGILQCDDVRAELQAEYGNYPQMFEQGLHDLLPDPVFSVYRVLDNQLPHTVDECDAWVITGSKFGVNDDLPWIEALCQFVRTLWERQRPLLGICFGHQLVAKALGGEVIKSEKGWGIGLSFNQVLERKVWMEPFQTSLDLLVSHQDLVVALPEQAEVLACSDFCPYYLLQYGRCFLTILGHPEFCVGYCKALIEVRQAVLPPARVRAAMVSLTGKTDSALMLRWMAQFLQAAQGGRA